MLNKLIIIFLVLLFVGCARDFQTEAVYTWKIMQERIPECRDKTMPVIVFDENLKTMGIYNKDLNLIVLKYAYVDVLEHEFRHACGDMMGENYQPIEVGGACEGVKNVYRL